MVGLTGRTDRALAGMLLAAALATACRDEASGRAQSPTDEASGRAPSPTPSEPVSTSASYVHVIDRRALLLRTFRLDLTTGMLHETSSLRLPGSLRQGAPPPLAVAADPLGRFLYVAGGSWYGDEPQVHGYLAAYQVDPATGSLALASQTSLETLRTSPPGGQFGGNDRTLPTRLIATKERVYALFQWEYPRVWPDGSIKHVNHFAYWAQFEIAPADGTLSTRSGLAVGGDSCEPAEICRWAFPDPESSWIVEMLDDWGSIGLRTLTVDNVFDDYFADRLWIDTSGPVAGATMTDDHLVVADEKARLRVFRLDRETGRLTPSKGKVVEPPALSASLRSDATGLASGPGNLLAFTYETPDDHALQLYSVGADGALALRDRQDVGGRAVAFHPAGGRLLQAASTGIAVYAIDDSRRLKLLHTAPVRGDEIVITAR